MMLLGVIGLGMSLYYCYNARHIAMNVAKGYKKLFHKPQILDEYGDVDRTAEELRAAELGAQMMTRDEFACYDMMKTISFLIFLLSAATFGLGKLGMRTVWREKSQCANRITKKSIIGLVFVMILVLMMKHESSELHKIIRRNQIMKRDDRKANHKKDINQIINKTDHLNTTEPMSRNLQFLQQQEHDFDQEYDYERFEKHDYDKVDKSQKKHHGKGDHEGQK